MATTVLLIRHGETAWNREKIFRGTHDVPLNDNGRAQARLVAGALRGRRIDAAFTSPLVRASETAGLALGGRDVPVRAEPGLIDFWYGDWTALPEDEVARRWPAELDAWQTRPHSLRVPGGNTLQEVFDAAFGAMERIVSAHQGGTVALFAHRVVNKLLVLGALGLGLDRFPFIRQDNCCVNEFQRVPGGNPGPGAPSTRAPAYIICSLNDTSHLRGGAEVLTADF